ncbi:hypothetical protein GGI42DRAFT_363940 [Trichoderma sp. SZMC 28013]
MPPSVIYSLSTEILELIFSQFCLHCRAKYRNPISVDGYISGTEQGDNSPSWYSLDRHALFSLCLVSRRFSGIAQSIFYHEFAPGYGDSRISTVYQWDGRLTSFMRTVAKRPDLARLVKRVYIHHFLTKNIDVDDAMHALDEAVRGVGHHLSHAWMLRIQRGFGENPMWLSFLSSLLETEKVLKEPQSRGNLKLREELTPKQRRWLAAELVSTVIAQLPNLDHLSLCVLPYGPGDCAPPSALEVLGISSLHLKTVDISLDASDIDMGFDLDIRLRGLLRWSQQLTTINLHKCSGTFSRAPILSLPRLANIRMTESRIGESCLESLLNSSQDLRTFSYEAAYSDSWNESLNGRYHFQSFHAIDALGRHRKTLEILHLDLRGWDSLLAPRGTYIPPFPSLKHFTSLQRLFLRVDAIFVNHLDSSSDHQLLINILPRAIVSLRIGGYFSETFPRLANALLGLADAVMSQKHHEERQFPRLRKIQCDFTPMMDERGISKVFSVAGIRFLYGDFGS